MLRVISLPVTKREPKNTSSSKEVTTALVTCRNTLCYVHITWPHQEEHISKTSLHSKLFKIATATNNEVKCKTAALKGGLFQLQCRLFHTTPLGIRKMFLKNKNKSIHSNDATIFIYWSRLRRKKAHELCTNFLLYIYHFT